MLLLSSFKIMKKGRSLRAHRSLSFSLYKMSPTPLDLLGITNDWMMSSLTLLSLKLDDWSVGVCRVVSSGGVEGIGLNASMGSLLRDAKALWPMIDGLSVRGTGSKLIVQVANA